MLHLLRLQVLDQLLPGSLLGLLRRQWPERWLLDLHANSVDSAQGKAQKHIGQTDKSTSGRLTSVLLPKATKCKLLSNSSDHGTVMRNCLLEFVETLDVSIWVLMCQKIEEVCC